MEPNKTTCFVLTNTFPYENGEPFLETELPYLANAFTQVYLLTIGKSTRDCVIRELPNNVRVIPLGGEVGKLRYLKYIIYGLKKKGPKPQVNTSKQLLAAVYLRGRATDIYERAMKSIEGIDIEDNAVVLYSYWFLYQALAVSQLKCSLKKQCRTIKAISRAHGYDLYGYRSSLGNSPYQRYLLESLDGVFTCSKDGLDYLIGLHGSLASAKASVARLGTPDYGLGNNVGLDSKVLVTCCNFASVKRMPLFAEAFGLLLARLPSSRWLCIGDGTELQSVKNIVHEKGLGDSVAFLGSLPNREILSMYQTKGISFFCNVSESEGVPVSIMEAESFGIPVLATDVGGVSEIVGKLNGVLLPRTITKEELAEALYYALTMDEKRYTEMSIESRRAWEQLSSAETNYTRWATRLASM